MCRTDAVEGGRCRQIGSTWWVVDLGERDGEGVLVAMRSRQAEPPGSFWSDRVERESVTSEDGEPWVFTLRGIWVGPGQVTAGSA